MRRQLLTIFSLLVSVLLMAGEVTEQQALSIAQQILRGKTIQQQESHRAQTVGDGQFYVFNAEGQGGFVIVSADDRTTPVLGYADQGTLDMANLPVNARLWLEGYAKEIQALGADVQTSKKPRRVIGAPVAPLVTARWDQSAPYNNQCPKDGTDRSVTGCVATAMAQVMYYHKWPETAAPALAGYTTYTNKIKVAALPATTFKWDKMRDDYHYTDTDEGAAAVAELMRYCGQAVKMDYGSNESAGAVSNEDFVKMGYSKTAKLITRSDYSTADWEAIIYNEMSNKRPVLYSGNAGGSGHQFIIDGYDNKGLFHVNWGWGGSSDGYFVLSVLNPDGRGIGGGTSSNGFTMFQDALIGIQRDNGEQAKPDIFQDTQYNKDTYTRTSSTEDFSVSVTGKISFYGNYTEVYTVERAWGLYKGGTLQKILESEKDYQVKGSVFSVKMSTLTFGAGLADGTYQLRQLYRYDPADDYQMCSTYWDGDFLLADIQGNTLTLSSSRDAEGAVQVNQVTWEGIQKKDRAMIAIVNMTNNGFDHENTLYVWLDTKPDTPSDYDSAVSAYLDEGQTGDVEISFVPKTAGTVTVTITNTLNYDYGTGMCSYQESQVLWTGTLEVEGSSAQKLTTGIEPTNAKADHSIEGTTILADVTLTNTGTNDYHDYIMIYAYYDGGDGYLYGEKSVYTEAKVPARKTVILENVEIPGLTLGRSYCLAVYYYNMDNMEEGAFNYIPYTLVTPTAIRTVKKDERNDDAPAYNLKGQRVSPSYKGLIIKNGKKYLVK